MTAPILPHTRRLAAKRLRDLKIWSGKREDGLMADVLKIALERRNKLHDEIKKLEDFIRMAETLVRGDGPVQMPQSAPMPLTDPMPAPAQAEAPKPAPIASNDEEEEESPMRAAARKLSDADVRRAPEPDAGMGADAPRPSIIRRGFGS